MKTAQKKTSDMHDGMVHRPRRLRFSSGLRRMVRETWLDVNDLVYPVFLVHGQDVRNPIGSMPGQYQLSIDQLEREAEEIASLEIPAVLLFGIPSQKDPVGKENFDPDGIIQQGIRTLKTALPELIVISDVCLCEYTDHGHCGLVHQSADSYANLPDGYVLNDETLDILARVALSHARAGVDVVAPSGMMDGMVGSIRSYLDAYHYQHIPILSYSVKYASAFYGPFREAAEGAPKFGDRKTHQMDPGNAREALREAALDIEEGADVLMVKPALPYLDIIRLLRDRFPDMPLAAYNVSGEYAMIKAAAAQGWLNEKETVLEALTGIKRAGADFIITYHAKEVARWLRQA